MHTIEGSAGEPLTIKLEQPDEFLMHDRDVLQESQLGDADRGIGDACRFIDIEFARGNEGPSTDLPGDMLWPDQHASVFRDVASLSAEARETLAKRLLEINPALVVYALPLFMYDPFIGDLLKQAVSADSEKLDPQNTIAAAELFVDNYHVFCDMPWAEEVYRRIVVFISYEEAFRRAALSLPHQIKAILAGNGKTPHAPNLLGAYKEDLRIDINSAEANAVIQQTREARVALCATVGMVEDGGGSPPSQAPHNRASNG